MRRPFIYILLLAAACIALAETSTRKPRLNRPRTVVNDSVVSADSTSAFSLPMPGEGRMTLDNDTGRETIHKIIREKRDLDNIVTFSATDSLVMFGRSNAAMYGSGDVSYGDIKLNAGHIDMSLDSATVVAHGVPDSTGTIEKNPVFRDKSGEYESTSMKYNFKTERGYITNVITEQGEGYVTGGAAKKMEDGSVFLTDGKYTTCDDHEHPHFYFQLTKAKVRPKKDIVTGPAYMVLADVPLPLAVPFGFFPFTKDYSSGIIVPSFGEDYNRGFYLRDGGYYFAINDYVDLALRGEIYTKGSWGVSAASRYSKRYKFNGNFDISFLTSVYGDKGLPDYTRQRNFRVAWQHTQDAKANPNMNFSASVDFTTSGYTRNDLNSYYNSSFTENTKSSTVNMTYRFPGTKWNLSTTANIAQRTQDSTLAVSFPNVTVTLSQISPFKRKKAIGAERWYEKIRLSYTGQFQNSLTATQDEFFKKSLIKDWRNGIKHYIPISATFSLFKYINISPSVTINDRMYFNKVRRQWNPNAAAEICDTVNGFYNVFDFNASIALDTKVYGFWRPMKFLGDKIQMVRHVLTPTVSFSGAPDFGAPFWGAYGSYQYTDNAGITQTRQYNYFQNGIFGAPSRGRNGIVSVSLANNLEMKVKNDNDSSGFKKISLIENLVLQQSYNFAADSLRLSNMSASILLRLTKQFNLNLNTSWDPYTYALSPSGSPVRVNRTRLEAKKGWLRLSSAGTSFSYSINNSTFSRKKDNDDSGQKKNNDTDNEEEEEETNNDFATAAELRRQRNSKKKDDKENDADGYAKWSVPWNLSFNYSVNYGYGPFDYKRLEYQGKWTQNLSVSGSIRPTQNWNFSFSASYDFDLHKIAYMNCSISRDLHCFTMSASFIPVGPYKSYSFHIAVKASMLKDLKYDKRSSRSNGVTWY